tara:strand:+ start:1970 stop:2296 length:327 start_codon:yes stop_codon:yes gene_type:complete
MVLLPLLFPFRKPASVYIPTHESVLLGVVINPNIGTLPTASGVTSVYGNSGVSPGVPIPLQTSVLSTNPSVSLFSGEGGGVQPEEPMKITSATLNKVALSTSKVSLYA